MSLVVNVLLADAINGAERRRNSSGGSLMRMSGELYDSFFGLFLWSISRELKPDIGGVHDASTQ